jgi:hypothetical protein
MLVAMYRSPSGAGRIPLPEAPVSDISLRHGSCCWSDCSMNNTKRRTLTSRVLVDVPDPQRTFPCAGNKWSGPVLLPGEDLPDDQPLRPPAESSMG